MACKCKCISYNLPETWQNEPEVAIDPRPYIEGTTKTVCVDACIADAILELWKAGVATGGCCCGHNIAPHPSVFLIHTKDVVKAESVLNKDGRTWVIMVYNKGGKK